MTRKKKPKPDPVIPVDPEDAWQEMTRQHYARGGVYIWEVVREGRIVFDHVMPLEEALTRVTLKGQSRRIVYPGDPVPSIIEPPHQLTLDLEE